MGQSSSAFSAFIRKPVVFNLASLLMALAATNTNPVMAQLSIPATEQATAGPAVGIAIDEEFPLPNEVAMALLSLGQAGTVRVEQFPVAPFRREVVEFRRVQLWADGAQIHRIENGVETTTAPPALNFFRGSSLDSDTTLSVRLVNGQLRGLARANDGLFELRQSAGDRSLQLVQAFEEDDSLEHTCGNELCPYASRTQPGSQRPPRGCLFSDGAECE